MKRRVLLVLLAVLAGAFALAAAFMWWAHQVYTVGMEVNLKAMFVYGTGILIVAALGLVLLRWLRRAR